MDVQWFAAMFLYLISYWRVCDH